MKLILGLIVAFTFSFTLTAQHVFDVEQKFHGEEQSAAESFGKRSETPTASAVDITHVNMRIEAEPAVQKIYGDVTLSYKLNREIDTLWLDFDSNKLMTVSSVQVDLIQNVNFYRKGNFLIIPIGQKQVIVPTHTVRVVFEGIPDGSDIGNYFRSDFRHVWTRSEPYGARYWWPCIMTLQDKIDSADIYLIHPKNYTGVSNGKLIEVDSSRVESVSHWKHSYPMAFYLLAFSVGTYAHISQDMVWDKDSIRVENYLFKHQVFWIDSVEEQLLKTFVLFDSLFGEYPFKREHYGHVQTGIGGGMEHQTMSHMQNLNQPLVAHELAHQWFGNKVTCGSWKDLWLNESFATYLTALTHEAGFGDSDWMDWKRETSNYIISRNTGSVFPVDTLNFFVLFSGRLTYNKGAYVLHTLRHQIGDKAFFDGIYNFIHDPKSAYGFAITQNLITQLELTSGRSLTAFFDDWYLGEGHPNLELVYNLDGNTLNFDITQTGSTANSPFFDFDIPISVYKNGKRTDFKFPHTKTNELFSETFIDVPDSVKIDPDYNVLIGIREVIEGTHINVGREENADNIRTFLLYPNPVKEFVRVKPNFIMEEAFAFKVTSSRGELVKAGELETNGGNINTSELSSGMYFIELTSDQTAIRTKFIKR